MNALARLSRLWRGCCLRMIPLRRLLSLHFIKTLQLPFPFRSLTDLVHSHIQRVNSLHRSLRTRRPIYARARAARPRRALLNKRAKLFHIKYQISNRRDLLQWHPGHSVLVLEPAPLLPPLLLQLLLSGPTFRLQQVNGLIDRIFRISTAMLAVTEVAGGAPFHLPIAREAWAQTQPA